MGEIDELEITVKPANKYAELNEAILDFSLQMAANTEKAQGEKMTKQDKQLNKEHCKNDPWDIKLQCWWFRNLDVILPILLSVLTSFVTSIVLMLLEAILQ